MLRYPDKYIHEKLSDFYSPDEVKSFTHLLLQDVCGYSLVDIATHKFNNLSDAQVRKLEDIVVRLQNNEPYQYILGETEFYGMSFSVTPDVLIPRPETEELVEWIVSENDLQNPKILDIGTGSGCIAVALAKKIPGSEIQAWDISDNALNVARKNAKLNDVEIEFSKKDILSEFSEGFNFDIIVSNPPYVLEKEKADMAKNVLNYEPHLALFVPDDTALIFYEKIAQLALNMLPKEGKLFFEINRQKGSEIVEVLSTKGFVNVELRTDISGNDRMIRAEKQ